ncbi:MAG TPA: SDR family NAD(P)-dependent oxidoreductase [Sphingobium sp.]|uniref:SDR family NAD(P)-dependent oxidoreductase n=1 Tax=Sphingobium sp. TaxID=1912891 RepID=UPI002ED25C28
MTEQTARRVAVITGASSGIGKATARALLEQGWHVIAHGRDAARSEAAAEELRAAAAPGAKLDMVRGDLALLSDVARLANEIAGLTDRVHVLLNNAGGTRADLVITPEGNEATFAGNHLGHFLLTERLLPLLRKAAAESPAGTVRIVNTSSAGHLASPPLDWDDLQYTRDWQSGRVYCLVKLYNVLHARELAKRLAPEGIIANAMHPGTIGSNFANHCEPGMKAYMESQDLRPPEEGADTLIWLATAPEAGQQSGLYFHKREPNPMSDQAQDDTAAQRLWEESEKLLAKAGY